MDQRPNSNLDVRRTLIRAKSQLLLDFRGGEDEIFRPIRRLWFGLTAASKFAVLGRSQRLSRHSLLLQKGGSDMLFLVYKSIKMARDCCNRTSYILFRSMSSRSAAE